VVARIARDRGARTAVKAKSMTAEEVELNEALEAAGTEVTETDLGEFIIQLAGEKPSHIMAPAIPPDRRPGGGALSPHPRTEPGLDVESLVAAARGALRHRASSPRTSGSRAANFAVARDRADARARHQRGQRPDGHDPAAGPRCAGVGIDKVVPRLSDVPGFLSLLTPPPLRLPARRSPRT